MAKKRGRPSNNDSKPVDNEEGDWEAGDAEEIPAVDVSTTTAAAQRDWRDLERYIEERNLKRQLEDNFWMDDQSSRPAPASRRKR